MGHASFWRSAEKALLAKCPWRSTTEVLFRPDSKTPTGVSAGGRCSKPGERLGGQGRGRTADLPIFSRTLVPTELPGPAAPWCTRTRLVAVLTGLEPATSALTGRRALQLLHRTLLLLYYFLPLPRPRSVRTPNGIRTRATALKGRRPGPLDDEGNPAIIAYFQLRRRGPQPAPLEASKAYVIPCPSSKPVSVPPRPRL